MGAVRVMADQLPLPPPLPQAAVQLLDQASRALAEAAASTDARQRYATAHLGALRAAAAMLAARTRPESGRRRPRSAWVLLGQVAPELGLHLSLVEACLLRPWPGNVRELLVETRSAIQAALMQGAQRVEARHLSPSAGTAFGSGSTPPPPSLESREPPKEAPSRAKPLESEERTRIEEALRQNGGNVAATARALGMHRTQLRRLLERHAIAVSDGNEPD